MKEAGFRSTAGLTGFEDDEDHVVVLAYQKSETLLTTKTIH